MIALPPTNLSLSFQNGEIICEIQVIINHLASKKLSGNLFWPTIKNTGYLEVRCQRKNKTSESIQDKDATAVQNLK